MDMAAIENPFEKVRPKMVSGRIELISQLAKFSHAELTASSAPEEWSAIEIAHHVYIADGIALEQIQLVQSEDNPQIEDGGEIATRLTRESAPPVSLDAVLGGMAARREELFEYLMALPATDWEKPLRHVLWGPIKFYQLVNTLPEHDRIHAHQLADLKAMLTLSHS
jgi:hypothetical protein